MGGKARSSNTQNRVKASAFQPRKCCRFCAMVPGAVVPEVTLNQLLISGSKVRVLDGPPTITGTSRTPEVPADFRSAVLVARPQKSRRILKMIEDRRKGISSVCPRRVRACPDRRCIVGGPSTLADVLLCGDASVSQRQADSSSDQCRERRRKVRSEVGRTIELPRGPRSALIS
jgi:hypothetical protein